jgi:transcriptional regulator with XRE-family HTH domain
MKDRISQFLIDENISPAEFADKIGVQRSSVSHVLNGRNYPSAAFIQKMLKAYKNLNPRWLILGDGNVYDSVKNTAETGSLFNDNNKEHINSTSSAREAKISSLNTNIANKEEPVIEKIADISEEQVNRENIKDNYQTNSENSDIERIVVFYKDKTFKEYKPAE